MKVHYVINNLASIVTCRRLERYFITAPHCCEMRFCNLHWLRYSFIANSHFADEILALTRCAQNIACLRFITNMCVCVCVCIYIYI